MQEEHADEEGGYVLALDAALEAALEGEEEGASEGGGEGFEGGAHVEG